MPAVLPIIGAIVASVGAGTSIYEAAKGQPTASPFPNTAQTQAQTNNLKSIIARGSGDVQQATGGGTSPNYLAELLGQNSGTLNNVNQLQDLISAGTPGVTSGGNPTDLAVPSLGTNSLSGGSGLADYGNIFGGS